MSIVNKPNTFSANTTISSSEVNDNFDTLYDDYNGNISAANLASGAVTTAKIAAGAVTTAEIAASTIAASNVNFGGSGTGIWWEEIGRTTLGVAGDSISATGLSVRKYIQIRATIIYTGAVTNLLRFNNDTGNTYAYRESVSGAADAGATSTSSISIAAESGAVASIVIDIVNVAAREKQVYLTYSSTITGAGNSTVRIELAGKWANVADAITRIDFTNTNTGDFAIGSEMVVLGHN